MKTLRTLALGLMTTVFLYGVSHATPRGTTLATSRTTIVLQNGFEARVQAAEKRISALKQKLGTNPEYKQHRGALATLENRKNTLKAKMKTVTKDAAAQSQLEQEVKQLEDKVAELEGSMK